MKVWNKETRNPDKIFYRNEDWGVDVKDDFFEDPKLTEKELKNRKDNFTKKQPPVESLVDLVPCDYDKGKWVLDKKEITEFNSMKDTFTKIHDLEVCDIDNFVDGSGMKEVLKMVLNYIVISNNKSGKYSNVHLAYKRNR